MSLTLTTVPNADSAHSLGCIPLGEMAVLLRFFSWIGQKITYWMSFRDCPFLMTCWDRRSWSMTFSPPPLLVFCNQIRQGGRR